MRTPALKLSLFSGFCALAAFAAPAETVSEKRIDLIFRPPVGECMAISADGKYLAFTQHVGSERAIMVKDLELRTNTARILADEDRPRPRGARCLGDHRRSGV